MRSLSTSRFAFLSMVALLPIGSGFAGVLVAKASAADVPPGAHATAATHEPTAMPPRPTTSRALSRTPVFPDAATLQMRAEAGRLDAKWLLTPAEIAALQTRIDRLNTLWHATTDRLHARMAIVTEQMIDRGELQPAVDVKHESGGGLIGRRLTVSQGVRYEKAFYAGDDAELDTLQHQREILKSLADRTVHATFN